MEKIHCMLCGGLLSKDSENTTCHQCGTEYPNLLISEHIPFGESKPVEISVNIEGMFVKKDKGIIPPFDIQNAVEESIPI